MVVPENHFRFFHTVDDGVETNDHVADGVGVVEDVLTSDLSAGSYMADLDLLDRATVFHNHRVFTRSRMGRGGRNFGEPDSGHPRTVGGLLRNLGSNSRDLDDFARLIDIGQFDDRATSRYPLDGTQLERPGKEGVIGFAFGYG